MIKTRNQVSYKSLNIICAGGFIAEHKHNYRLFCTVTNVINKLSIGKAIVLIARGLVEVTDVIDDVRLWGASEKGHELMNEKIKQDWTEFYNKHTKQ